MNKLIDQDYAQRLEERNQYERKPYAEPFIAACHFETSRVEYDDQWLHAIGRMYPINGKALAVCEMIRNVEGIKCVFLVEPMRQLRFRTKRKRKPCNDDEEDEEGAFRSSTRSRTGLSVRAAYCPISAL